MRCLAPLLLLAGCASPLVAPVERADRAAEARIEQVERATADALRRAEDAAERRVADLAETVGKVRRDAVEDVDARLTAQRVELLAAVRTEREALVAAFREESAAWRAEAGAWRAEVATIRAAFVPGTVPAPSPSPAPGPVVPYDELTWIGVAGALFTAGKSVWRKWSEWKGAHHA